ncbi:MAG TPA: hypothetical protein VF234_01675, partial [Limnochordia bacterium]
MRAGYRAARWMGCVLWLLCLSAAVPGDAETVNLPAARPAIGGGERAGDGGGIRMLTADRAGWRAYERGFSWDGEVIAIENGAPGERRGALYVLRLDQQAPEPVRVTAESRAENVSGASDQNYSLYLDIIFQDGTPLWGQTGNFQTGTHDWERQTVIVSPTKPIREIYVYALFRHHTGRAWFRNIEYAPLGKGAGFDGIPVGPAAVIPPPGQPIARVSSAEGLTLAFDAQGRLAGGSPWETAPPAYGGFLVRDALAGSGFVAGEAKLVGEDGAVAYQIGFPALELRLDVEWRAEAGALRADGRIVDTSGRDRGVTVVFALPIDAVGGTWWDDIRHGRPIGADGTYAHLVRIGAGANGFISPYPLSAVVPAKGPGWSLAIPPDVPRLARLGYDGARRWLYAAVDVGLSSDSRTPGEATFAIEIDRFQPRWGFREAFRRYQSRHPAAFERRIPKSGIWMAFAPISTLPNPGDFGFQFHESPPQGDLPFDREAGIYPFRYIEPQSYWMPMSAGEDRSYEGIIASLQAKLRSGRRVDRENAWATQQSGAYDAAGRFITRSVDAPWNRGALFTLNPDPAIKATGDGPTKAELNYAPGAVREAEYAGLYIDSIEGWGETCNFRREHFATAASPLVFDMATGRVCLLTFFSVYDFTRYASDDLHRHGKWVMANATPSRFPFFLPLLDVAGTEVNWLPGGEWRPDADDRMNLRRTLSGTKPYLLLMNTDFERFGPYVERYFQRSLFYGFLPSMFSENASDNHYFRNPAWYERDRALFRRYIPVIRRIADAG